MKTTDYASRITHCGLLPHRHLDALLQKRHHHLPAPIRRQEQEKLIRHYPNFVLHLRVSIEATTHYKEGGFEIKLVASVPNDTVVVTRKAENVRAALTESFDVLSLQLKEIQRKKRKIT